MDTSEGSGKKDFKGDFFFLKWMVGTWIFTVLFFFTTYISSLSALLWPFHIY